MSENIKMVDLRLQYEQIKTEVDQAIQNVLTSSAFINGPAVKEFARDLEEYLEVNHIIPCANGTDALQIALMALDLPDGAEVIVPSWTYVAAVETVAFLGLRPVFVEVEEGTFNIDARLVEEKITPKTAAIIPVHLYGQCANMEEIVKVAAKHGLPVIEDAAQAIGAEYRFSDGRTAKAGTIANIGTTSFFPSKNLGCYGDGGAIMTQDDTLAEKMRLIANHGQKKKYINDIVGVNSRLDTLQAAILKVKLKYLDQYAKRRNQVADFYDQHFRSSTMIFVPERSLYSDHVFHQYTLRLSESVDRDSLKSWLQEKGVPSMIYYPIPNHLQTPYRTYGDGEGSMPISEKLSRCVLSLPIHTEMEESTLQVIVDRVLEGVECSVSM